jgi:hypothetical protein
VAILGSSTSILGSSTYIARRLPSLSRGGWRVAVSLPKGPKEKLLSGDTSWAGNAITANVPSDLFDFMKDIVNKVTREKTSLLPLTVLNSQKNGLRS